MLFTETELGNYFPFAYQEDVEPQAKELPTEVFLVHCNPLTNLTCTSHSTEMLIESKDDEPYEDGNLGLLDGFQDFMEKYVQDRLSLGARMDFQDLLLPRWCRFHNASHSEFECCNAWVSL